MTDRDAFWAAKIITRFTREELAAIVATGELSDQEAERYFLDALVERQHKSARYYLNRVNPIDEFEVTPDGLSFVNLSARYGFAGPETDRAVAAALGTRSDPYAGTYRVPLVGLRQRERLDPTAGRHARANRDDRGLASSCRDHNGQRPLLAGRDSRGMGRTPDVESSGWGLSPAGRGELRGRGCGAGIGPPQTP